jgi:hypothetical protein
VLLRHRLLRDRSQSGGIRSVPKGRLRIAQDAVLGRNERKEQFRKGRLRIAQDAVLGRNERKEQSRRDG